MSQGSKKPIKEWGLLELAESETCLEKVGDLRGIAVLVQFNLAFLTFTDLHLHGLGLSSSISWDFNLLLHILRFFFGYIVFYLVVSFSLYGSNK